MNSMGAPQQRVIVVQKNKNAFSSMGGGGDTLGGKGRMKMSEEGGTLPN